MGTHQRRSKQQFEKLTVSELYCPRCKISRPVRERLLLLLPGAELYEFRCQVCGESLATRENKAAPRHPGIIHP